MKEKAVQVRASVPLFVKDMLFKISKDKEISISELISDMLVKQIVDGKYAVLTKNEQRYAELKRIEKATELIEYIRSKNAKKINFIKNVRKQMYLFSLNSKTTDVNDIKQNLQLSLEIAQTNHWTNEVQQIKEFLKGNKQLKKDNETKRIIEVKQ